LEKGESARDVTREVIGSKLIFKRVQIFLKKSLLHLFFRFSGDFDVPKKSKLDLRTPLIIRLFPTAYADNEEGI